MICAILLAVGEVSYNFFNKMISIIIPIYNPLSLKLRGTGSGKCLA